MKLGRVVLVVGLLLAGASAFGQNLRFGSDPAFRLPESATYDSKGEGLALPLETVEYITDLAIRNTLDRLLQGKGFKKLSRGRPDFLIKYYVGLKKPRDVRTLNYGVPPGLNPEFFHETYPDSTLIIDIIDGRTNQLAWQVIAEDALSTPFNETRLRQALAAIVERFAQETGGE